MGYLSTQLRMLATVLVVAGCSTADDASDSTPATDRAPTETAAGANPATDTTSTPPRTTNKRTQQQKQRRSTSTSTSTARPTRSTTTTTTAPPPAPPPPSAGLSAVPLALELVADVELPTAIAWRPGDPAPYVTTQDGFVLHVGGDEITTVLDLSAQTVPFEPGSERGLLGIAFDPNGKRMFLNYTDLANDTQVVSFAMRKVRPDAETRRHLLSIEQPGLGHNAGRLLFDSKGRLYIGSGDGGGSNGRDAQDTTKLLGAILRVVPSPDGDGYSIPAANPFVDGVADRPEVIARGFRNPWTFSLDEPTADLWIGDVGNNSYEEIDRLSLEELGQNFGWYWFEGDSQRYGEVPDGLTPPVHSYSHEVGVAVIGGHVYRGTQIPELDGAYLFGDLGGPIQALGADGVVPLDVERVRTLVGWGEDPDGELYVLSLIDGVFRLVRR